MASSSSSTSDKGKAIVEATTTKFKNFDVVPEASDHYYATNSSGNNDNPQLYSHIMKEWKILEQSLPESIYIQVYETRIDLMRAMIIGAPGTPYHDGLFFFDILLPRDYPQKPPQVYYHSHGYRVNPNLYANGKLCLSLINTWTGSEVERWISKTSTILQVLVSIQGLVLNGEPYFNEPGVMNYVESTNSHYLVQNSNKYNETIFILSCNSMVRTMRKPPKNFEDIVAHHFRERAESILAAVAAYRKGCPVGQFNVAEGAKGESKTKLIMSGKLKAELAKAEQKLKRIFEMLISGEGMEVEQEEEEESGIEERDHRGEASKSSTGRFVAFILFLVSMVSMLIYVVIVLPIAVKKKIQY